MDFLSGVASLLFMAVYSYEVISGENKWQNCTGKWVFGELLWIGWPEVLNNYATFCATFWGNDELINIFYE